MSNNWIPWRDLETPSAFHPVVVVTSDVGRNDFLNGGTVLSQQVLFGLKCGHAAPARVPLQITALRCAWHDDVSDIVAVIVYEWHAKCNVCTFGRWAGLSKHNAQIFITNHVRRNAGHEGVVEYAQNPNAVATLEDIVKNATIPGIRAQS